MKNCKLCGGSLLKDFDPNCDHFEAPVPEPQMREVFLPAKNEKVWRATIRIAEGNTVWADHPLKEMAIAKAKARFETRREIREKVKAAAKTEEPVVQVTAQAKTGQRWRHKVMDRVVVLKDFSVINDPRGAWHVKDEKGEIRRIREDILVEDYVLEKSDRVGRIGQRWKHKTTGNLITLTGAPSPEEWDIEFVNGTSARVHVDLLQGFYDLIGERPFEEWLDLARGTSAQRRLLTTELKELGYPPRIYMPMHPERRARICAEGTRYGVPSSSEAGA